MKRKSKVFLICLMAEMLNFIVVIIFFDILKVSLFLDTIFTVAITFYFGLVPGLLVSIFYNLLSPLTSYLINGVFEPTAFFFTFCGIAIVLVTWLFSRYEDEFRISRPITVLYLILIAMLSSFCSIMIGGFIDYVRFSACEVSDKVAPIKKYMDAFLQQDFNLFAACIIAQVPVSFIDRLITTFLGYKVYKLLKRIFGDYKEW